MRRRTGGGPAPPVVGRPCALRRARLLTPRARASGALGRSAADETTRRPMDGRCSGRSEPASSGVAADAADARHPSRACGCACEGLKVIGCIGCMVPINSVSSAASSTVHRPPPPSIGRPFLLWRGPRPPFPAGPRPRSLPRRGPASGALGSDERTRPAPCERGSHAGSWRWARNVSV